MTTLLFASLIALQTPPLQSYAFPGGDVDALAAFVHGLVKAPVVVACSEPTAPFVIECGPAPPLDKPKEHLAWMQGVLVKVAKHAAVNIVPPEKDKPWPEHPVVLAQKFAWFKGVTRTGGFLSEEAMTRAVAFDRERITVKEDLVSITGDKPLIMGTWSLQVACGDHNVTAHWLLGKQVIGLRFSSLPVADFLRATARALGGRATFSADAVRLDLDGAMFREQWQAKLADVVARPQNELNKSLMTKPLVEIWTAMLDTVTPAQLEEAMDAPNKFTVLDVSTPSVLPLVREFVDGYFEGRWIRATSEKERAETMRVLLERKKDFRPERPFKGYVLSTGRMDLMIPMTDTPNLYEAFFTRDFGIE